MTSAFVAAAKVQLPPSGDNLIGKNYRSRLKSTNIISL